MKLKPRLKPIRSTTCHLFNHSDFIPKADGSSTSVKALDNATLRLLEASPASYVGKRLVIKYRERTTDGSYRHPMWDHLAGVGE